MCSVTMQKYESIEKREKWNGKSIAMAAAKKTKNALNEEF